MEQTENADAVQEIIQSLASEELDGWSLNNINFGGYILAIEYGVT